MAYKAKIFAIQAFIEGHEPLRSLQLTHVIQPIPSHEYHLIYLFYFILTLWNAPQILHNLQEPVSWSAMSSRKQFPDVPPWRAFLLFLKPHNT